MEAHSFDETNAEVDGMSALLEEAYKAARAGRLEDLELHLARLRAAGGLRARGLGEELYAIARCVRAHPSYRPAGGEGRAAV